MALISYNATQKFLQKILYSETYIDNEGIELRFFDNCVAYRAVYFCYFYNMIYMDSDSTKNVDRASIDLLKTLLKTYSKEYFIENNDFSSYDVYESLLKSIPVYNSKIACDFIIYVYNNCSVSEQLGFLLNIHKH